MDPPIDLGTPNLKDPVIKSVKIQTNPRIKWTTKSPLMMWVLQNRGPPKRWYVAFLLVLDTHKPSLVVSFKGIPFRFLPNTRKVIAGNEHQQVVGFLETNLQPAPARVALVVILDVVRLEVDVVCLEEKPNGCVFFKRISGIESSGLKFLWPKLWQDVIHITAKGFLTMAV